MSFRFADPAWLMALALLPALAAWLWRRARQGEVATVQYSDLRLVQDLPRSARVSLRWLPTGLRLVGLACLILALARPQSGRSREVVRGKGIDIVMVVDISSSMAALDFEPQNRLGAAKQVIDEFIQGRRYDRIGLVVFARDAFNVSPPTFDYHVLRQLLDEIQLAPDLGLEDATAIGLGLANAANMLKASDAQSQVIILLTDGVNNAGQIDPLTAAQAAATLDIKVYTVAAARPGQVPVPVQDPFFGQTTQMMESEIDEESLQQIAEVTGGLYFRAQDSAGLAQIYEQIDQLEKSQVEIQTYSRYRELAGWGLGSALALMILEQILRGTVFRSIP